MHHGYNKDLMHQVCCGQICGKVKLSLWQRRQSIFYSNKELGWILRCYLHNIWYYSKVRILIFLCDRRSLDQFFVI